MEYSPSDQVQHSRDLSLRQCSENGPETPVFTVTPNNSPASTMVDFLQRQQEKAAKAAPMAAERQRSNLVAKGRESLAPYGRVMFHRWGESYRQALEQKVSAWVLNQESAGPHYAAMPLLLHFSTRGLVPVAATSLMVALDQISRTQNYQRLASRIGRAIEDEARAVAMYRRDDATARTVQRGGGKQELIKGRTLEAFQLKSERWQRRDRSELGGLLLDTILESTPILVVTPGATPRHVTVGPSEWAQQQIQEHRLGSVGTSSWPLARPAGPVEADALEEHVHRRIGSVSHLRGVPLFAQAKALQRANETALRLDPWMVGVVADAWEAGMDLFPSPPPVTDDQPKGGARAWESRRRAAAEARGQLRVDTTIRQMRELAAYKEPIWIGHCMDFRGRIYTDSGPISYQGPDFVKGCLEFALPGGLFDLDLALMAAATHWGHGLGRATWSERLEWGQYHTIAIANSAKDPIGFRWWTEADSPWQLLQVCRAIAQFKSGVKEAYLPVRFDQTCSGVGHAAALVRDQRLATLTNMLGDTRRDVYEEVRRAVEGRLKFDLEVNPQKRRVAELWLEKGITRSLVKRPVMSCVYGARHFSIREGYAEELLATTKIRHPSDYERLVARPASYLAAVTMAAIRADLWAVLELQMWMRQVVRVVTRAGREVEWNSPSGMPVRLWSHRSGKAPANTLLLGNAGWWTEDSELRANELASLASGPGATANLIHSFDAAVAHALLGSMPGNLLSTHDCFAVPCDWDSVARLRAGIADVMGSIYRPDDWPLGRIWSDICSTSEVGPMLPEYPIGKRWDYSAQVGQNPYLFS